MGNGSERETFVLLVEAMERTWKLLQTEAFSSLFRSVDEIPRPYLSKTTARYFYSTERKWIQPLVECGCSLCCALVEARYLLTFTDSEERAVI